MKKIDSEQDNSPEQFDKGESPSASEGIPTGIRTLRDLIDKVSSKNFTDLSEEGDAGLAEVWPFPFLGLVGQQEMKLGLLLSLINPAVGGVLLVGPRGTGKTTAVRSLIDLMPYVQISNCYYGCTEEDIEFGGEEAVCSNCLDKYKENVELTSLHPSKLVELPLNSKLEDVIGGLNERAAAQSRMQLHRGILSHADKNILYIDEVNLLKDEVVDAILDASAQGRYTVRRGPITASYRSKFVLVGTMNPEEGNLRPQILDRFGLRILVRGLEKPEDRLEAYKRTRSYLSNPKLVVSEFADETILARDEIQAARDLLPKTEIPDEIASVGLKMVKDFGIVSLRAEITLFEAARALAAADGRIKVSIEDLKTIAPMTLRLRRSKFIREYFEDQNKEEKEIQKQLDNLSE